MSFFRTIAATALLAASAASAQAATFSFQTIDDAADPTFNQLLGINEGGLISGYFGSGAAGHPNKGYIVNKPYTTFVPLNLPGSTQTQATGLNNTGLITGFWSDTNLGPSNSGAPQDNNFGFIRNLTGTTVTYLDVNDPLVGGKVHIDQVLGVNPSGTAVGFYNDANGNSHGFTYSISTGKFTAITQPAGVVSSAVTGINTNNLLCGFVTSSNGVTTAFERPLTGGSQINFVTPGSTNTQFLGVNNSGIAVGFYADANNIDHGLYFNPANGMWQAVNAPGGVGGTVLNGLNDHNQLVGFYTDAAGNTHGLLVTVTP